MIEIPAGEIVLRDDRMQKEVATYGPYRVFRGGGWNDPARGCLASNRRRSHPSFFIDDLGFRIARNICGMAIQYLYFSR